MTTHQPLHPSQLSFYLTVQARAGAVSCALVVIVWLLIVAAGFVRAPSLKSVVLGAGVAVAIACKPLRKLAIDSERISDDVQDISQTAFQHWLYQSMKPDAAVQHPVNLGEAEIVQDIPAYDLASVRKAHHLAIVGATGAGKTQLTQWLVARYFQGATVRVYDPDAAPGDWGPLPVVGMGGDFISVSGEMLADLQLLDQRCKDRGQGRQGWGEEVRIAEEYPAIAAELSELTKGKSVAASWLKRLTRRGRKYKLRLVLVSQDFNVQTLDISGEGQVRKNFCVLYLGGIALERAALIKDKAQAAAFLQHLQSCNRPCLVDNGGRYFVANIPELPTQQQHFQPSIATTTSTLPPTQQDTIREADYQPTSDLRKSLEGLYQASPDIQDSNREVTTGGDDFALFQAIKALLEVDKATGKARASKTWVVENVLGCKGRKFEEGKQRLEQLLQRYRE